MKLWVKRLLYSVCIVSLIWTGLTIWVEVAGKQQVSEIIAANDIGERALIVYNPDPIYNLDEQVCFAFAKGLQQYGINSKIVTNKRISLVLQDRFDLYVFCANTYNFFPDRGIVNAIKQIKTIGEKPVVAITLGSGATTQSKKSFEKFLDSMGLSVIGSQTYWLMKPNDEARMNESNVSVAVEMANKFAISIANRSSRF